MSATRSATEARVHFGELIEDEIEAGSPHTIEHEGKPLAILIEPERHGDLASQEDYDWLEGARRSRELVSKALAGRPIPDIRELIDGGRTDVD